MKTLDPGKDFIDLELIRIVELTCSALSIIDFPQFPLMFGLSTVRSECLASPVKRNYFFN